MSTCKGSLPPHDNCPHGKNCDYNISLNPNTTNLSYKCQNVKHKECDECSCICHKINSLRARLGNG